MPDLPSVGQNAGVTNLRSGSIVGTGRTAEIFEFGAGSVVKVLRPGVPAYWAEMEAEFTAAVRERGAPTPIVRGLTRVDDRPAIVFERVEGPSMWARMVENPANAVDLAGELAAIHLMIHADVAPGVLPDLIDRVRGKIGEATLLTGSDRSRARRLAAELETGCGLYHGDLHPGNVLMSPRGPVVIDWFDAAAGSAVADVVRSSLLLRPPVDASAVPPHLPGATVDLLRRIHREYLRRVLGERSLSRELLQAWEAVLAASRLAEVASGNESELVSLWRNRGQGRSSPLIVELRALGALTDDGEK